MVGADQRPVQRVGRLRHHHVKRWSRGAVANGVGAVARAGVHDVPDDHREAGELLERVGELGRLWRVRVPAAVAAATAPVVRPRAFSERAVAGVGPAEVGIRRVVGHGSQRQHGDFLLRRRLALPAAAPGALPVTITTRVPRPQHLGRLDLGRPPGVAGVRLVGAVVDLALDVDAVALPQVLLDEPERRGQAVPHQHAVPLRLLAQLPVAALPAPRGTHRELRDAGPAADGADLGIGTQVADQSGLVEAARHRRTPSVTG